METNFNKDQEEIELKQIACKKVDKLKYFYIHLFVFVIVFVLFILKEYTNLPFNFFPIMYLNWVVMILWSTVFLGSAIDLFTSIKIFGEEWEERKVKSILDKRNKKQKWE
ncbi:hypothetical protein AR687_12950 [Flavobacteriaceae bacterium CRH]|nr:hypothetical protein AR687_12950 [Flavobacteriaceae bacterium CRH]